MPPTGLGPPPKSTRAPRVEIVLRVEFESVGQLRADFLSNLSSGGMFVRTTIPFVVGQVLNLQLGLPGVIDPPANVECEVRWVTSDQPEYMRGVGLAFRTLSGDLRQRIERVMSEAAPVEPTTPEPGSQRPVSLALLIANPILQEIIRGELERLSHGGTMHRAAQLKLEPVPDPAACAAIVARGDLDAVIADCDGLSVGCAELVRTLRGTRAPHLAVIVLQGPDGHLTAPPNDSRTIVLRKPVGMRSLYTTLLALSAGKKTR